MIIKDRRQHKCSTENCRGVVYIERGAVDKIKCTDCSMCVTSKRETDKDMKPLLVLREQFNG